MQKYNSQCRIKPKWAKNMAGESNLVVRTCGNKILKRIPQSKVGDEYYVSPFEESMLYLSTILDLYNNEVIAYKINDTQNAQIVLDTLETACHKRNTAGAILHSDQGAQYTYHAFQVTAKKRHYHQHVLQRKLL